MDRDIFLGRVGRAVMSAELPPAPSVGTELPDLDEEDFVGLFRERAQAVDAVVHGPMSHHGVPKSVAGIASGHHGRSFMAWDELPASGVVSALSAAGLQRLDHDVPDEGRLEHQMGYYELDIGVTGSDAALAASGSVVLTHGPGRPRMASLAPRVHIALVELDQLHPTLAHWAHRHPGSAAATANLVVVTGPSRTGDIEQQLNLGVHGPRHVHLVLIR